MSDELLAAVERAIGRYKTTRAKAERVEAITAQVATLTPRERQVFRLVIQGKINKQIARELGTTERTIKAHRQKVMEKTRARSLPELVRLAEQLRISERDGVSTEPVREH